MQSTIRFACLFVAFGLLIGTAASCLRTSRSDSQPSVSVPEERDELSQADNWWCVEHAVPEAVCSICSEQVAEQCKARGDWCEAHERADSQCFDCHPEFRERFAAIYRAKYGTEPPSSEKLQDPIGAR